MVTYVDGVVALLVEDDGRGQRHFDAVEILRVVGQLMAGRVGVGEQVRPGQRGGPCQYANEQQSTAQQQSLASHDGSRLNWWQEVGAE